MSENCKNCGGGEGIHHYETMQCPFGGVEANDIHKQIYVATHFEPENDNAIKYAILRERTPEQLSDLVNSQIEKGWRLQGGVSCSLSETDEYLYELYAQAMVMEADTAVASETAV